MKLVIAMVQGTDADRLLAALNDHGLGATRIVSAGGYLREANVTLLIGVDDARVPEVADIVQRNAITRRKFVNPLMPIPQPVAGEVIVAAATLFVLNVSRFERILAPAAKEDSHGN